MGRRLGGGHGPLRGCVRRGLLEMLSGISNVPAAGKRGIPAMAPGAPAAAQDLYPAD